MSEKITADCIKVQVNVNTFKALLAQQECIHAFKLELLLCWK